MMNTLRLTVAAALLLCAGSVHILHAQRRATDRDLDNLSRWDIGATAGGALYFGDLVPARRSYLNELTPQGGLMVRYDLGRGFGVRGSLSVGTLSADDSRYDDPAYRQHRNFAFTTILAEGAVLLEYDVLRTNREATGNRWGVSVFAGLGLAYTHPKRDFSRIDVAYFGNEDRAVSGLGEEQSGHPGHIALVAPVGLGISYDLSRRATIFLEGSVRQGFDDQIDGFSKSVGSGKNDAYAFCSLGFTWRLTRRGWWI